MSERNDELLGAATEIIEHLRKERALNVQALHELQAGTSRDREEIVRLRKERDELREALEMAQNNSAILAAWKADAMYYLGSIDERTRDLDGTPWKDGLRKLLGEEEK